MADKIPFRDQVAQEIIKRLEAGVAPWQKPWKAGTIGTAPFNPTTGKLYRGINDLWLSMYGYDDPRWMTYRQAEAQDAHVRKGEHAATIECWQWETREPLKDQFGKPILDEKDEQLYLHTQLDRPRVFYAKVFNAGQIEGLAPWKAPAPSFDPLENAEAIIAGAGVPVRHTQNNRAFYRPMSDEIHLPVPAAFKDQAGYYETVLHELGHATGHENRLNRFFGPFGSEGYAREELRAEIASYMLARDMGISFDPSNHAAYVESWLGALREDKNEIFRAARDAETIKTWVMEPEQRQSLEHAARQRVRANEVTPDKPLAATPAGLSAAPEQARSPSIEDFANKINAAHDEMTDVREHQAFAVSLKAGIQEYAGLQRDAALANDNPAYLGKLLNDRGAPEADVNTLIERARIAATWPLEAARVLGIPDAEPQLRLLFEDLPRLDTAAATSANFREWARAERVSEAAALLVGKSPLHAELTSAVWDRLSPNQQEPGAIGVKAPLQGYIPPKDRTNQLTFQLSAEPFPATAVYKALGMPASFVREGGPALPAKEDREMTSSAERTYIAVPFREKNEAKALGAKWDRKAKSWYIPTGVDAAPFAKWSDKAPDPAPELSPEQEFADFLKTQGLLLKESPRMDGQWHRVPVDGDKGAQQSGAYRGFLDGRPAGLATNYKAGAVGQKWVATGISLSDAERAKILAEAAAVQEQRKADRLEAARAAAKVAFGVWQNLPADATPDNCPYLKAKGVQGYGVKVDPSGDLVVPARDADGRLWGVQMFHSEGKRFIRDSQKVGTMHVLSSKNGGKLADIPAGDTPILMCEGYATGAMLHESTGYPTVIAFDSGNLLAVAEAVRAKFPNRQLLQAADNDHANKLGNVGEKKAAEAAEVVKALFISPPFNDEEKARGLTDFDDFGLSRGKNAVRHVIGRALMQARRQSEDLQLGMA